MWQNSASFFACSLPMERLPLTGLGLLSRRICRRLTIPDRPWRGDRGARLQFPARIGRLWAAAEKPAFPLTSGAYYGRADRACVVRTSLNEAHPRAFGRCRRYARSESIESDERAFRARHFELRCRRALRRRPQGAVQTGGSGARAEPPVPGSDVERESRAVRQITPGHHAAR